MLRLLLITLWAVTAVISLVPGARYYMLPVTERVFTAQHELFAPTGTVGHSYGIAGAGLMITGVVSYSLRKRWRVLSNAGKLKHWLQFHIFCCTLGPFLVVLHTSFKFGGLVAISFYSMVLVVASGVFGRYVYVRIPKTVSGRFQTLDEVRQECDALAEEINERSGRFELRWPDAQAARFTDDRSLLASLWYGARAEAAGAAQMRRTRAQLLASGVSAETLRTLTDLIKRRHQLERQLVVLQPFHRLFRYWHVFHLPFAIIMFVILAVHVGVAVMFGYGLPF